MTDLSPAAQAVRDAALKYSTQAWSDATHQRFNLGLAAALRAAADQASPEKQVEDIDYVHQSYVDGMKDALAVLLEIADELDPPTS